MVFISLWTAGIIWLIAVWLAKKHFTRTDTGLKSVDKYQEWHEHISIEGSKK
jgi:hypothetical protein